MKRTVFATRAKAGHKGPYGRHVGKKPGRNRGGVPYRCGRCERRARLPTLPHRLTERQAKKRQCCGHAMYVDWYRFSGAECRATRCDCGRYPFRHRKGSLFCEHGAAGKFGFHFLDRDTREFEEWYDKHRGVDRSL